MLTDGTNFHSASTALAAGHMTTWNKQHCSSALQTQRTVQQTNFILHRERDNHTHSGITRLYVMKFPSTAVYADFNPKVRENAVILWSTEIVSAGIAQRMNKLTI